MVQLLYYSMYIKGYVEQENYVKFVDSFRETGDLQEEYFCQILMFTPGCGYMFKLAH